MTFTYSGDPTDSDLDAVRFLVGDTDADEPHLSDEETEYLIAEWLPVKLDIYAVAAEVADAIAGKYAREITVTGDGMSIDMAALQAKYTDLANQLRARARSRRGGGKPDAGGVDLMGRVIPGTKPMQFGVGVMDNIRAGQQNYGGTDDPRLTHQDEAVE